MGQNLIDQSRAEIFAQGTLGKDPEAIKTALRYSKIVIGIPEELAKTRQGQIALVTAVNILSRLGPLAPNLYIDVPRDVTVLAGVPLLPAGQLLCESLLFFMRELAKLYVENPNRCQALQELSYDCGLFIGEPALNVSTAITIGSEKWLAVINPKGGKESINTEDANPLGTILAATLGSIEVVKHLWLPIKDSQVNIEPLPGRTVMSAFDMTVNAKRPNNPDLPCDCQLGHVCVFGLGAIGSGFNYVLGCIPRLQMSLDFIDNDVIEQSNQERLFTSANPKGDIRQPKVVHAQQFLKRLQGNVQAFAYPMLFEHYVDMARERLGYVLCCLDNARARRLLQTELASVIVNGGTDMSRWVFSLHELDRAENACLRDLYPEPPLEVIDPMQQVANLLSTNQEFVRQIAQSGGRFDEKTIAMAMQKQQDPAKKRLISSCLGLTFEQVVAHRCSEASPNKSLPAATISFVSLMPAIFMVADLIKRRLYNWRLSKGESNVFQFDSFRLPQHSTVYNILAAKNCLCQSAHYLEACRERQRWRHPYLSSVFSQPASPKRIQPPPQRPRPMPAEKLAKPDVARRPAAARVIAPVLAYDPDRFRAVLMCIAAFLIYLMGIGLCVCLICLFVEHEGRATDNLQFWHLVSLASKTEIGLWPWVKYTAVSALPMAVYPMLMLTVTRMIKEARVLYHGGGQLAAEANVRARTAATVLAAFFTTTGMPFVSVGSAAFGIITSRLFWEGCKEASEEACCFVVPLSLFLFCLLFIGCLVAILQTGSPTWERCAKVFDVPIRGRKRHRRN